MKNRILSLVVTVLLSGFAQAQSLQEGLRAIDFEKYEASRTIFLSLTAKEPANGDNWYYLGQDIYKNIFKFLKVQCFLFLEF